MNASFEFLKNYTNIPEESFEKLQSIAEPRELLANTILFSVGEIPTKIFLLTKGVLRSFYSSESGKDHNRRIYTAYSFAAPIINFLKKQPSDLTFETLTDCNLFEIDLNKFYTLKQEDTYINQLYTKVLEQQIVTYEERYRDLILLNATERYLNLRKQIPDIDQLIPQYQIASYINITPVQLSRIRKSLI